MSQRIPIWAVSFGDCNDPSVAARLYLEKVNGVVVSDEQGNTAALWAIEGELPYEADAGVLGDALSQSLPP